MRKILSIFIAFILYTAVIPINAFAGYSDIDNSIEQYEVWAMSPCITGGVSKEELIFQRALKKNRVNMYPLEELGERYYFATCEGWTKNSGYNGKTDLATVYYYLLLLTDDGYIILDFKELFSDYTSSDQYIANVSGLTVQAVKGDRAIYIIKTGGRYTNRNWTTWQEYVFVTENKQLAHMTETDGSSIPVIHEGQLYWKYETTSSAYLYPLYLENGNTITDERISVDKTQITEENGYKLYESYNNDIVSPKFLKLPETEDLYYTVNTVRGDPNLKVNIYKNINGIMKIYKENSLNIGNSYYLVSNSMIKNISDIDKAFYISKGYSVPVVIIDKKYVLTNTGELAEIKLNSSIYSTYYYNLSTYYNRLAVVRCKNGSSYIYDTDGNGNSVSSQAVNYIFVNNKGQMELSEDILLPIIYADQGNEGQNGYYYFSTSYRECTAFTETSFVNVKDYFGRAKTNVFSDGRYVTGEWCDVGDVYELWYNIHRADGTVCSVGPTGYMASASDALYDPYIIVENDTKFIVSTESMIYTKVREFYRVSVIENDENGVAAPVGTSIGSKNIETDIETDTEPVERIIDFRKDNLPIGFNIKNNVINPDKFTAETREEFNSVKLNDVVILKKEDYQSGVQNTGITLDNFSKYDSSFGDGMIRIYTNGQNFCWYCSDTSVLTEGTYNKSYSVGDKTIYVTIKIIDIPDNKGTVTVVF